MNTTVDSYYSKLVIDEKVDDIKEAIDKLWIIVATGFIFLMQLGFTMLEAGSVRSKNSSNILLKNVLDACVGAFAFYSIGYSFSVELNGGILGTSNFFASNFTSEKYLEWIFLFTYCTTSTTIVSGSLAERTYLDTYLIYSFIMTAFVYPVLAGWVWGKGWMHSLGYLDFGGSSVVHMTGGVAGLVGTIILGPRIGYFVDLKK